MILRTWRGWTRRADADAYVDYLRDTGMREYGETPGNLGAFLVRRDDGDRTEFLTLSIWESMDAVRRFAGNAVDEAVFYPEDDRFLVERETRTTHYDIADQVGGVDAADWRQAR